MGLYATAAATHESAGELHTPVELIEVLSWAPGVVAAIMILLSQLLGRAGMAGFALLSIATLVVAGTLYVASSYLSKSRRWLPATLTRRDALVALSFLAVAIILVRVSLHGSTFAPVTFSVDLAHHGAVVEWMRVHQVIPTGSIPTLGGQANYPAGSHTITAVLSWLIGLAPLQTMWVVSVGLILSIWLTSGSILHSLIGPSGRPYWLVPIAVSLACWRFTLGMISYDFFFAQLFGIWIAMSSLAAMVWWSARNTHIANMVGVALLASSACLFSYPQSAPIPIIAVSAQLAVGRFNKRTAVVGGAVFSGVLLAVFAYSRSTGVDVGSITGIGEGARTPITISMIGGWVVLWLFLVGLFELVRSHTSSGVRSLIGAMLAPSLLATLFALLRLDIFGGYPVTDYRIQKNIYALMPFAVIVASYGVVRAALWCIDVMATHENETSFVWKWIPPALVSIVVFASLLSPAKRSLLTYPIVTEDEYKAMSWATSHAPPNDVGLEFSGLTGYHLWWMKSGRPVLDLYPSMGSQRRLTRWDNWPTGQPERFLVSSGQLARNLRNEPGVKVAFQSGEAVVFERTK